MGHRRCPCLHINNQNYNSQTKLVWHFKTIENFGRKSTFYKITNTTLKNNRTNKNKKLSCSKCILTKFFLCKIVDFNIILNSSTFIFLMQFSVTG